MDRRTAMQSLVTAAAAVPLTGLAASAANRRPVPGSGYVPVTGDKAKPPKQKMVLVGAGSAMFTQGIIIDWIKQRPEGEWEIALVDINPVILEATDKMVRRYMEASDRPAKITAAVDRRDVLDGATIIICTIGVGSRQGLGAGRLRPAPVRDQPAGGRLGRPGGRVAGHAHDPAHGRDRHRLRQDVPERPLHQLRQPHDRGHPGPVAQDQRAARGALPRDRGHHAVARATSRACPRRGSPASGRA